MPGDGDAAARAVEDKAVVAALDPRLDDAAHMQRRGAMAAAVGERRGPVFAVAEQHQRIAADAAGERFGAEFVGPGGDIPGVAHQHRQAPE